MARSIRLTSSSASFSPVSFPIPPSDPPSAQQAPLDLPRPTLGDIPLAPRRPLRDGRSSRGSSVSSSSSRSVGIGSPRAGPAGLPSRRSNRGGMTLRRRVSAVRGRNTLSDEEDDADYDNADSEYTLSETTSPPPPARPQQQQRSAPVPSPRAPSIHHQELRPARTGADILAMVDELVSRHDPHPRPIVVDTDSSSAGSSTSSNVDIERDSTRGRDHVDGRRYTAQEKGKGRAVIPPIEIEDEDVREGEDGLDGSDSFEVLDRIVGKRRRDESDMDLETESEGPVAEKGDTGKVVDEEKSLGSYTCPVCFSPPEQAVMTLCGHVLCARCLLDSLLAAIKRNPNPLPGYRPPGRSAAGGRGRRGRGRGANAHGGHGHPTSTQPERYVIGGPTSWNPDALRSAWYQHLVRGYLRGLAQKGIEKDSWDVIRDNDPNAPKEDDVMIKEELKGLWSIDGLHHVVEGECPVCRKGIPGGMGPANSGIGGVIPLQVRLGGLRR